MDTIIFTRLQIQFGTYQREIGHVLYRKDNCSGILWNPRSDESRNSGCAQSRVTPPIITTITEFLLNNFHNDLQIFSLILPLKNTKGPDTPRVLLARSGIQDPSKFNMYTLIAVNSMIMDIIINEDDQAMIAGLVAVQDMKGATMAHMAQMTPSLAKKSATIFQEAMPTRPKEMHYLNFPSFMDTIFQMIKPFIKEKLQKRVRTANKLHTITSICKSANYRWYSIRKII